MKRLFIFFIFSLGILTSQAQQKAKIQTQIERIVDENITWIKLTITNKGNNSIMLNNMCRLSNLGNEIGRSDSYATAVVYDKDNKSIGFSNRLSFVSFDADNGVNLKKGDTEVQVFLLKTDEIPGFFAPSFSEKDIKSIELKVHLSYKIFVPNGIATAVQDLVSNRIFL